MNKFTIIIALIFSVMLFWLLWPDGERKNIAQSIDVARAMGGDSEGFTRAVLPRVFHFPQDHGPHSDYKTEWWYFTGNLETELGRRFSYQLTLFRIGLSSKKIKRTSLWATSEIYMGHFALTDRQNQQFYRFEKFSRSALGLSGAQANPFKVWLDNWRIESAENTFLPLVLQAEDEGVSIQLTLGSNKPIVLQGNKGLSKKSAELGNASYYYSMTRLQAQGVIRVKDEVFNVRGESWLDREWSTSALGKEQAGWDWFSLQLNDGRDIMFYQLRRKDGSMDPYSSGSIVSVEGESAPLTREDVRLTVTKKWQSLESGIRYPIHWRMEIKKYDLVFGIKAIQPNQEMLLSAHYWEGAVDIFEESGDKSVIGRGYLELTGYAL